MRKAIVYISLAIITVGLLMIPLGLEFGKPHHADMDEYFLRFGQEQTATNNQCTSVTFDFRGFDTLGESTVLFTAVIGVALMFRKFYRGEDDADE
jgi:multisubunit Na+/H+ antiporter MnhB subunit